MNEQPNRTFVCSVLFLDIVEYSKRSVAEQMTLKQRFNALLGQVLRNVAVSDRIVLDTGDGAAISFLGNPEDTLFAAMTLRDAIASEPASSAPSLAIRIGVNLGPVRLIKDLNGQLNIIGDGINVAQRVMGFAVPGQILVSRSYFEVVSRLSPEFSQLFQYEGSRTDKHVREHEVYTVGPTSIDLRKSADGASAAVNADRIAASRSASAMRLMKAWLQNPRAMLPVILPLAVAIVLAAGVAIRVQRKSPESQPAPQTAASLPAAPASEEQETNKVSGPAEQGKERPAKIEPAVRAVQPVPKAAARPPPPKKAAVDQKPALAQPPPPAPVAATPAPETAAVPVRPPAPAPASLHLAIIPWGEVFVDGQSQGVSPPVKQITVTPGKHLIVVRNTSLPQHTQQVDLKPGEQFTIRHRFD